MKKRNRKKPDEIDFWQSQSDLLTGLVLVLLLVILLLTLYLIHLPDEKVEDYWKHDYVENEGVGGGDGGGAFVTFTPTPSPTPSPTPTPTPTPGGASSAGGQGDDDGDEEGEEPYEEEGEKSAVYVMLVDGETNLTIKEKGILFDLYGENGTLITLNTYYPEKINYKQYATTDEGVFYLPEKIFPGSYYIHGLTAPEGYDPAPNVHFSLEEYYDWPKPYVVRVPVYPSTNVIRLQMLDADTGQTVSGGTFEVRAAENITTADGTRRCRKGEVVDTIECDERGYGVSSDLYLGKYEVEQLDIPPYYSAVDAEELSVELGYRTESEAETHTLNCRRTRIVIRVSDELYPTRPIEGAVFSVSTKSGSVPEFTVSTDARGEIELDSLEKDETYLIEQVSTVGDYYPDITVYELHVSKDGFIDGESTSELSITNWVLRVSINVVDALLQSPVPNVSASLYDENGRLIRSFSMGGSAVEIEDLKEGRYYLVLNGDESKKYEMNVKNTREVQKMTIRIISPTDIALMAGAGFILLIACITALILLSRKRKKRAP